MRYRVHLPAMLPGATLPRDAPPHLARPDPEDNKFQGSGHRDPETQLPPDTLHGDVRKIQYRLYFFQDNRAHEKPHLGFQPEMPCDASQNYQPRVRTRRQVPNHDDRC